MLPTLSVLWSPPLAVVLVNVIVCPVPVATLFTDAYKTTPNPLAGMLKGAENVTPAACDPYASFPLAVGVEVTLVMNAAHTPVYVDVSDA